MPRSSPREFAKAAEDAQAPNEAPKLSPGGEGYEKLDQTPEAVEVLEKLMSEYNEIIGNATRVEDVAADCWGALFFVIVHDLPQLLSGDIDLVGKVRIVFSLVVFSINLLIQGTLLYFICKLLMLPSMLAAQNVYRDFSDKAFSDGSVSVELFDSMSSVHKGDICGLALSQALFVRVIIFLWITTNVSEFKDIYTKLKETLAMPILPAGLDRRLMVRDNPETPEKEVYVVCMTTRVKVILCILIFTPKVVIAVFLMAAGSLWLLAAEKITDLILNSLALAFVTQIDELICQVFFPPFFIQDLANMAIACQEYEHNSALQAARQLKSFAYSSLVLVSTILVVELAIRFQPVIPDYHGTDVATVCFPYLESQVPWCLPGQVDCFIES